MKKPTHKGIITHPQRRHHQALLRETDKFWIDNRSGQKYRKTTGTPTGDDPWDARRLILSSIEEIESSKEEAEANLRKIPLKDTDAFLDQVEVVSQIEGKSK